MTDYGSDLSPEAFRRPWGVDHLARWVLDIFYRRVEIRGLEKALPGGAVVFVGNHVSGLLDPAIFLAYLPRASRFLGKSTLWHMPPLRPFLKLAAAIPVYRRQDPGVDSSQNESTFDLCHQVLAAKGTIALFPEGRSHNEPSLVPLKTGVARIVLEAVRRFPGIDVSIVPVGLTFDDKTRFRSRLLVVIGEAIRVQGPEDLTREASREQVRSLTDEVAEGLAEVTLNYPSWQEARLIQRAGAIYSRQRLDGPAEQSLAEHFSVQQVFIDGYDQLIEECPEQVKEVKELVREYDHGLDALRLKDEQVASAYSPTLVLRFVAKSLFLLGVRFPLGLVGTILNFPAYWSTHFVAEKLTDSPDVASTYKIFPALVIYPITWSLWALAGVWAAGAAVGSPTASLTVFSMILALGPICGVFAIRFHQRKRMFWDQARAFLLLRSGRKTIHHLKEQRAKIVERVHELAAAFRGSG